MDVLDTEGLIYQDGPYQLRITRSNTEKLFIENTESGELEPYSFDGYAVINVDTGVTELETLSMLECMSYIQHLMPCVDAIDRFQKQQGAKEKVVSIGGTPLDGSKTLN